MSVNPDTIKEREQMRVLVCNDDERLANPVEIECPVCSAMVGEPCVALTGAPLAGRYHEGRRDAANHTFLPRGVTP